jgi:ferrochelatase
MKTAVVLFNLGGPDSPAAVKPFRINLFMDRAIIRAPIFIRFFLARLIAGGSQQAAEENYAYMGGKSPLLELTKLQAASLQNELGDDYRCFIAMRYWHPFASETVRAVKSYAPDRVILLPLYPQFSTTTTGSSIADWHEQAVKAGLITSTATICCYYNDATYIAAITQLVADAIKTARAALPPAAKLRLLFSAHGLPESIVTAGDPYQAQIEATTASVIARLADPTIEHVVCYQSRATPQKWLAPSTIDAIEQAGRDNIAVLLIPIAFVSDHIETLVELDIENKELAEKSGVPAYFRAAVPNDDPQFITALAGLVHRAQSHGDGLCSFNGPRACDATHRDCPWSKTKTQPAPQPVMPAKAGIHDFAENP